jgi:hypothetical protein
MLPEQEKLPYIRKPGWEISCHIQGKFLNIIILPNSGLGWSNTFWIPQFHLGPSDKWSWEHSIYIYIYIYIISWNLDNYSSSQTSVWFFKVTNLQTREFKSFAQGLTVIK